MKIQKAFTIPRLCTCKGDLKKSWYVYFYYTDLKTGQKQLCRYKFGINRLKTAKERERESKGVEAALLCKLNDGWNPITENFDEDYKQQDITVIDALNEILSIKKSFLTSRSNKTYTDQINLFIKWLKISKYSHLYIQNFDKFKAQKYLDWLLKERGCGGKTHNGNLGTMKTFFTAILDRYTVMKKSPFAGIKKVPEDQGKNTTYSKSEQLAIEKYLLEHDKQFYYVTMFMKYCFFRRSELVRIQIKHIQWENKTIKVPSEVAKNRVQDAVTISRSLEKIIEEMGILEIDPEMYIFGKDFMPSLKKLKRVDDFSDRQREINKLLEVKKECTFYSWKHTGVCDLYNTMKKKDVYAIMRQCRHTDIKMTMIYMRSLGLVVNEDVRDW